MIRRRGENISAFEVEKILSGYKGVADCVVVGVSSSFGDQDVKAVVVPAQGALIDPVVLYEYALSEMARYMVPRYIEVLDSLPYNDVGKLARQDLENIAPPVWDAESSGKER